MNARSPVMPAASAAAMPLALIMAGGTGGHVFPALALARELRARSWQVVWLGTRRGLEARLVPAETHCGRMAVGRRSARQGLPASG